jgi:hypothetical protein
VRGIGSPTRPLLPEGRRCPNSLAYDRQSCIAQEMFEDRALELGEARIAAPSQTLGIDGEIESDTAIVDNENPAGESDRQL